MDPELLAALRVLLRENLGDWVYDVRSRAAESGDGYAGNSWDHPRVTEFSEAVQTIAKHVKQASGATES